MIQNDFHPDISHRSNETIVKKETSGITGKKNILF